jgi:hypothetical protein
MELTLIKVTWVAKKLTSPLATARSKAALTSSGRLAGTLTDDILSGSAVILSRNVRGLLDPDGPWELNLLLRGACDSVEGQESGTMRS